MFSAAAVLMIACDRPVVVTNDTGLNCSGDASAAELAGNWIVSGSGSRSGCTDSRYEGAFTLGPSQPIAVAVTTADAGASTSTLAASSPPSGFSLSGSAQSTCIKFTTSETTNGQTTTYEFSGTLQGTKTVTGTLTGTGPGPCIVAGSFSVVAQ